MQLMVKSALVSVLTLAAFSVNESSANAAPNVDGLRDGHIVKEMRVPQGKSARYAHAEVLIKAPIAAVRKQVLNFGQYHTMSPEKFRKSRVVKRHPNGETDVYLQFGTMNGIISFYTLGRFSTVRVEGKQEVVEGKQIQGDVRDANIVWRMEPVSDNETLLTVDNLLVPDFYAPQAIIEEELLDSADKAALLMRNRAEAQYAEAQKKSKSEVVSKPR